MDTNASQGNPLYTRYFFVIGALLVSVICAVYFWKHSIICDDDAFTYFTVSKNWLQGYGPVINPGDAHCPVTSFLWLLLLSGFHHFFPSADYPLLAHLLSTAFIAIAGFNFTMAFRKTAGDIALLAPFVLVTISLYCICVGMDIYLSAAMVSLALWNYFSGRIYVAAVVSAICFFCRGEAVLIFIPLFAHYIYDLIIEGKFRECAKKLFLPVSLFLITLVSGAGLIHHIFHVVFPHPLRTKILQGHAGWITYFQLLPLYIRDGLGFEFSWNYLILVPFGMRKLGWPGLVFFFAAVLHSLAYSVLGVAGYLWYAWFIQAAIHFYSVFGAAAIGQWITETVCAAIGRFGSFAIPATAVNWCGYLVVVILCFKLFGIPDPAPMKENSHVFNHPKITAYMNFSAIINKAIAEKPKGSVLPIVLSEEIGVLSYYLQGAVIRDPNGLASPGLTLQNLNNFDYWINLYHPDYLVRFADKKLKTFVFNSSSVLWPSVFIYTLTAYDAGRNVGLYQKENDPELVLSYENLKSMNQWRTPDTQAATFASLQSGVPALYAPSPAEYAIPVSGKATQIEIGYGLGVITTELPQLPDGITLSILGIRGNGQKDVLMQEKIEPVIKPVIPDDQIFNKHLSFPAGRYNSVCLVIDPNPKGSEADWPIITKFIVR